MSDCEDNLDVICSRDKLGPRGLPGHTGQLELLDHLIVYYLIQGLAQ